MSHLAKLLLFFVGVHFLQTQADKYTDGNRPYEFGFTIDGEQHRHEKKDENGIIMGEFGFITADGVYHVTVYATDENGNFKILSMKNIRVKPYPTSPGIGVKNSKSLTSIAQKDSIPESTKEEKTIKKQIASPAKSCSHCSLPTTTTTTTTEATPVISRVSEKSTYSQYIEKQNHNQNDQKLNNNNPILQNDGDQKIEYNSKTHQSYPQAISQKYQKEEQNKSPYGKLSSSQNLGYQEPNIKPITPQSYPQTIGNQNLPQQNVGSNNPVEIINPNGEPYFEPQNSPPGTGLLISVRSGLEPNNPAIKNADSSYPQSNPQPNRSLQGPVSKEDYQPNQALAQNNEEDNRVKNYNQNDLNNNNYKYAEAQKPQNYEKSGEISQPNKLIKPLPPAITSRQSLQPQSEGDKSILENPKGQRSPKSFGDFIQQSVSPEELASTGPNLYRPSLPKASEFSGKPILLAAQMQNVAKNTNIYNKSPGEKDGLPEGITIDDMTNLLYTFNYTVGFHGHHEKGYLNGAKQGYYYVTGRNGVRTRVDYIADENGFRPKLTQEILDIVSDEVPKPETEKDEKYGVKGYEFKWLYFPLDSKSV